MIKTLTATLTATVEEKAAISKIVSSVFDKCSHSMANLFQGKIADFYVGDWERILNILKVEKYPLENVELQKTLRSKFFSNFKTTIKKRLQKIVASLNKEEEYDNFDTLFDQFVTFEFKGRKFFGKAKKLLYQKVSEQIVCVEKFEKFSNSYLMLSIHKFIRGKEIIWTKIELYNRRNFTKSVPKISINVIVDAEGNNYGNRQIRPANEVQIVGIDEVLGALTLMLTKT